MIARRALLVPGAAACFTAALPRVRAQDLAADPAQATRVVQALGEQLTAIVNAPGTSAEKQARIAPLIERDVDVDGIARFCLGRFWRTATPQQQQTYVQAFHGVMIGTIMGHLGEFQGVGFTMTQTVQRQGATLVGTRITRPNQEPAAVQWVVDQVGDRPRIVDVVAEGTSLRLTQRSDYASYLQQHGNDVDALIAAMRRQTGS